MLAGSTCFALDADEIAALVKKPHDREGLAEEMKFFPDVRKYTAELEMGKPGEEATKINDITVEEKTVEGKYIVSVLKHPDPQQPKITMVVSYDKEEGVYRKWIVLPGGGVAEAIGAVVPKTKTISWFPLNKFDGVSAFGTEHHTDDLVRWKEVLIKDGKVVGINRGMAKKVK